MLVSHTAHIRHQKIVKAHSRLDPSICGVSGPWAVILLILQAIGIAIVEKHAPARKQMCQDQIHEDDMIHLGLQAELHIGFIITWKGG